MEGQERDISYLNSICQLRLTGTGKGNISPAIQAVPDSIPYSLCFNRRHVNLYIHIFLMPHGSRRLRRSHN